jgi:hypothetical protein
MSRRSCNTERTPITNDYSIIGIGAPMMSFSQQPIELDDVLYTGEAGVGGYGEERDAKLEVEAWRVIQLNYRRRYVRMRNSHGCEQTISFAEGCPRSKLYHQARDIQKELLRQLDHAKSEVKKEMETRTKLMSVIDRLCKEKLVLPEAPVRTAMVTEKKHS